MNLMDKYLEESEYVNYNDPLIRDKANELRNISTNEMSLIENTYLFVRDTIKHSFDVKDSRMSITASDVLYKRTGLCYSKAILLAALLRANGIPSGFSHLRIHRGNSDKAPFTIHTCNTAYVSSLKKWIRLDARGNNININAQICFDSEQSTLGMTRSLLKATPGSEIPNKEMLAYNIKYTGDKDYNDNRYEPDSGIIKALKENDNAITFYLKGLPSELSDPDMRGNYDKLWAYIKENDKDEYIFSFDELSNINGYWIDSIWSIDKSKLASLDYELVKLDNKEKTFHIKKLQSHIKLGNSITDIRGSRDYCNITFDNGTVLKCYGELTLLKEGGVGFDIYKSSLPLNADEIKTLRTLLFKKYSETPDAMKIIIR